MITNTAKQYVSPALPPNSSFSQLLIPIHRQLVPNLPAARAPYEDVQRHWPFDGPSGADNHMVFLVRMEDSVSVLGSQTRPKKMTWVGSNGRRYIIVAKPNVSFTPSRRCLLMALF